MHCCCGVILAEKISSGDAPAAIGPYSQAIGSGDFVYCSGQLGLDSVSGKLVSDDVAEQAAACLKNISHVLAAAGLSLNDVVKTTVFLTDLHEFEKVNSIYAKAFGEWKPARSTIQVAALPKNAKVEIEAVAARIR